MKAFWGAFIFYMLESDKMQSILFLGGDNRTKIAYQDLKEKGFKVESLGLFEDDNGKIEDSNIIIFPVPATRDFKTVNCPITNKEILFSDIKDELCGKRILSGGALPIECPYENLLDDDSYAILNAIPTAEGAISFCIENTPFTLFGSKVLVIGFGRVSKVLISRLQGFGCDLTVSARKSKDFAFLDSLSVKHINTACVSDIAGNFDVVFNTIDVKLFENLESLKNTTIIDLSTKGCIDFKNANDNKIKAYKLPGIPGKIAPITAGKILAKTLYSLIKKND